MHRMARTRTSTVDEDWPRVAYAIVSCPFVKSNRIHCGGATVVDN